MKKIYGFSKKTTLMLKKSPVKIEVINGEEHKIVPGVILVEGVHYGSGPDYPIFYSSKVLEESTSSWVGIEVTNSHPKTSSGDLVSLNDNAINKEEWVVGFIKEAFFENNSIKVKVALNKNQVEKIRPELWEEIENLNMEVSTGLAVYLVEKQGAWNNENYGAEVDEISPDHLALLPDEIGACSMNDGCGIRNALPITITNKHEEPEERYKRLLATSNKLKEMSFGEIRDQISSVVYGYDKQSTLNQNDYKFHYVRDVYPDYFIFSEETSDGVRYFKQGYKVNKDNQVEIEEEKTQVTKVTTWKPITTANNKGVSNMSDKKTKKCCPEKIEKIISNKSTGYTAEDVDMLEALPEKVIDSILLSSSTVKENPDSTTKQKSAPTEGDKSATLTGNAVVDYISQAPPEIRAFLNNGLRHYDKARTKMIEQIMTANKEGPFTEEQLKKMDDDTLSGIVSLIEKEEQKQEDVDFSMRSFGSNASVSSDEEEPYVPESISNVFSPKK